MGLGTPKRDLRLAFDTGSDLTWTQCEPCTISCYNQVDPIFDPSKSTSYSKTACTSPVCSQLTSATDGNIEVSGENDWSIIDVGQHVIPKSGNQPRCSSTLDCVYIIRYGDGSFSVGDFSKDRLTITTEDVLDSFLFGCGQDNEGLFKGAAGLLGLGRNQISIVKQAAQKYGQFFSYCLPSTSSSTGHLTFGNGGVSSSVKFTALQTLSQRQSFYGLDLIGLSVGGHQLSIPTSTFSTGTIIDSGTVITRLPPTAYSALRKAFREAMRGYPMTSSSSSLLDTCYDLSKNRTVKVPLVSFLFGGGLRVDLEPVGVLYVLRLSEVCLAFAGNSDASSIGVIGNTQQRTLEVVYDVAGGRIGFGPGGCR
ncbi:Protein ASPARTIC PROTEASE IN GUARD CELL 1 [Morella rubra]|uniref:Protein ASPARTIC PROTEASE IN GUARD CELL 1 n=1 Tax=Morella rubra TaxID=262757 RepID=A0A6A1UWJ2_9ROSI|nr:Protein ASPARTIC PROTEASE IN GUARD CELL 1 [Morella rubra]